MSLFIPNTGWYSLEDYIIGIWVFYSRTTPGTLPGFSMVIQQCPNSNGLWY